MLSQEDNDLMCRVGAGTPMGNALRRYWVPVLSSYQLPAPDCDPVSVEIFGEKLVAFRNTEGAIGVLDEHCCHRSASLVLGRVEGCGIRCLFHGWKYAVDGTVMETPNVADPRFRARFKARAYPVREAGGIIWTYVGPKELEPPFPHWPYFDYPSERRLTVTFVVPANFVQVQEALLDSSHLTILHQDSFKRPASADIDFVGNVINVDGRPDPKVEAEETTFGFHYAALRQIQSEQGLKTEARITSYCAPFHILNANGDFVGMVVPIDDYRTLHHFVWWSDSKVISQPPLSTAQLDFVGLGEEAAPQDRITSVKLARTRQTEPLEQLPSRPHGHAQWRLHGTPQLLPRRCCHDGIVGRHPGSNQGDAGARRYCNCAPLSGASRPGEENERGRHAEGA